MSLNNMYEQFRQQQQEEELSITTTTIKRRRKLSNMNLIILSCLSCLLWCPSCLLVAAGSCREAQLCCSGRDSSCVVQKAPMNAIIEDLNDKPCYCDHACLKLGDCCTDFKDHCGVLDCDVGDWSEWSDCDNGCGKGVMTRTRQVLQMPQNGGKHCPTLLQKRQCHGHRCHSYRDRKILREMALLLPAALSHSSSANKNHTQEHNKHYLVGQEAHRHTKEYCVEFEVFKTSKSCQNLPPYNLLQEGDRISVHCNLGSVMQDTTPNGKSVLTKRHKRKLYDITSHSATATSKSSSSSSRSVSIIEAESNAAASNVDNFKNTISNAENQNDNASDMLDEDDNEQEENGGEVDENNEENDEDEDEEDELVGSDESEQDTIDYDAVSNYVPHKNIHIATRKVNNLSSKKEAQTNGYGKIRKSKHNNNFNLHCIGEGMSGHITRWSALPAPSCRGKWLRLSIDAPKKCTNSQFIFV